MEIEMIDRQRAIEGIRKLAKEYRRNSEYDNAYLVERIIGIFEKQPIEDPIKAMGNGYCLDCEYFCEKWGSGKGFCVRPDGIQYNVLADDFCSSGKRKTEPGTVYLPNMEVKDE